MIPRQDVSTGPATSDHALKACEVREPARAFYARLATDYGSDIDLAAVIRESRQINPGREL